VERQLSIADKVEKITCQSLLRVDKLRQSIFKIAFEGKLVSHDPSDEPASMVLQRIKTERSKLQILGKANKKTSKMNNNQNEIRLGMNNE